MSEDKLPQRHNPAEWQHQEGGAVYRLDELSRNDLMQVACAAMAALESAEDACCAMQHC